MMPDKPKGTPGRKRLGEQKRIMSGFRIDPECKAWLDRQATREGTSQGKILDKLIRARMNSWLDEVP